MLPVFQHGGDVVIENRVGLAAGMVLEFVLPAVQAIEATGQRAYPEVVFGVLIQAHHPVIGQASGSAVIVAVMDKSFAVVAIETAEIRPDPKPVIVIDQKADNNIVGKAVRVGRVVQELTKTVVPAVKIDQAAAIGADPDIARRILHKFVYIVETKTVRVARMVAEE